MKHKSYIAIQNDETFKRFTLLYKMMKHNIHTTIQNDET